MTERYIYSLYDAKTGCLLGSGTPQQLTAQGWYKKAESVYSAYNHQKKRNNKPRKWRLERRPLPKKEKEPECRAHRTPGSQSREVWFYCMFDAAGNLVHEGTARQLVEKGLFKDTQSVANAFYAGHCRPQGICLTRKKVRQDVPCKAPGTKSGVPEKRRPPIACIEKPDALQRDVHDLCLYNAAARKAGKKELSYGYWADAGKPEAPA